MSGVTTGKGGVAIYQRALVFTAIFAGLRMGEMRALTWSNVDFAKAVIRVRVAADRWNTIDEPKTRGSVRDVPMAPPLALELERWRTASPTSESGLVFVGEGRKMLSPETISQSWRRLQHRAANEGRGQEALAASRFKFHALRHVCASLLIESGLPPKRIQAIMGHSSIKITFDRYGHLFDDPDLGRAVN